MHDHGDRDWLRGRRRDERNNGRRCPLRRGHERDCCLSTLPAQASNSSPQIRTPNVDWQHQCVVFRINDDPVVATVLAKKSQRIPQVGLHGAGVDARVLCCPREGRGSHGAEGGGSHGRSRQAMASATSKKTPRPVLCQGTSGRKRGREISRGRGPGDHTRRWRWAGENHASDAKNQENYTQPFSWKKTAAILVFAEMRRQIVMTLGIANYVLNKKVQHYFFSLDSCLEPSLCAYFFKFFENSSQAEMMFNCFLVCCLIVVDANGKVRNLAEYAPEGCLVPPATLEKLNVKSRGVMAKSPWQLRLALS